MKLIVKREKLEEFDERKIYRSCYAVCLNAHYTKQNAKKVATAVTKLVVKWVKKEKGVINSKKIRAIMFKILNKIDPEVAFLYETHLDIS
ncbi:hypothetical protein HYX19_02500 [Candidatus Woesearchaeota archaeon]|nr:hypothetical protein [Candidatus Woesearchaeota archaeon]